MRFHFNVIILLATILYVGRAKEESDLKTVYDKLAIVTRVTNAIFLQAAAIKKTVRIRDVVVELLKVDSKNFTTLIDYKPEMLSATMDKLFSETEKVQGYAMKNLDPAKKWLEMFRDSMENSEGLENTKKNMKAFFDNVLTDKFIKDLDSCRVYDTLDYKKRIEDGDKSSTYTVKHYSSLLNNCLKNVKKLVLDSSYTNNTHIFSKLESLMDHLKPLKEEISKQDVNSHLSKLKGAFSPTQGIISLKNHQTASLFKDAIEKTDAMFNPTDRIAVTLTLGFPTQGDAAKVTKDLDSDWFKNEIARGKSVDELKKELKGFFKFADFMTKVEDSWANFGQAFRNAKQNATTISTWMTKLVNFEEGPTVEKIFTDSMQAFPNCKSQVNSAGTTTVSDKVETILRNIGKLITNVANIQGELDKISSNNAPALNEIIEKLGKSTDWSTFASENSDSVGYGNLQSISFHFGVMKEKMDDIKKIIDELKTNDVTSELNDAVDTLSGLHNYLECLKNKGFSPKKLLNIYTFIHNVVKMSDPMLSQQVQIVLSNYVNVRNDVLTAEQFVKDIGPNYRKEHDHEGNPVLKLEHSQDMVLSLGRGMEVLKDMARALELKDYLTMITQFPEPFNTRVVQFTKHPFVKKFWPNRKSYITKLLDDLQELDDFAGTIKNESLLTMRKVLDEAIKVQGFPKVFELVLDQFKAPSAQIKPMITTISTVRTLDLDFASHKGYLHAASLSFDELREYYDEVFGLKPQKNQVVEHNYLTAILICLSILILLVVAAAFFGGLTKCGRKIIRTWYFYYFAKEEDFEKRWRYALFMDKQDGKNALLDAAREINATNVLKAVKKGAYINAFNQFGNTALHVATKRGYPEIVEILIKNGADRTYLNARNKTPEQLIPENWRTSQTVQTDVAERFDEVEKVYKKYKNRKFRKRVPEIFPSSSFHIYVDEKADETLTSDFMKKFQAITSNEALPTTTHYIVRTDQEGVLELDSLELLLWILSGVIIVKDTWMTDCLKDPKMIEKDELYLVKNVRYKGVLYDTVIHWSESMAKFSLPYLCGVYVGITIPNCQNLIPLTSIIVTHGGVICSKFPEKSMFNVGSHPYLHAHLGPIFIIHDGKQDVELYRNDPDKMYTLFTEEEFVHFLLKRGINVDVRPEVIPATTEPDD